MKIFDVFILTFAIAHTHSVGNNNNMKIPKSVGNSRMTASQESETVIENKNVNIVVNVDPKEVAKELWSIIEERIDNPPSRRSPISKQIINELESIITPVIKPSRRSQPSAYEVASALDHVTRKAFKNDFEPTSSIENEIITRNTVAEMMKTLKLIQMEEIQSSDTSGTAINYGNTRRTFSKVNNDNVLSNNNLDDDGSDNDNDNYKENSNDYIKFSIKVKKGMLLKALYQ